MELSSVLVLLPNKVGLSKASDGLCILKSKSQNSLVLEQITPIVNCSWARRNWEWIPLLGCVQGKPSTVGWCMGCCTSPSSLLDVQVNGEQLCRRGRNSFVNWLIVVFFFLYFYWLGKPVCHLKQSRSIRGGGGWVFLLRGIHTEEM